MLTCSKLAQTNTAKKLESCEPYNESLKPKRRSDPRDMEGWVTGRTKHPEMSAATGWPTLLFSSSSTPMHSSKWQRTAAEGKTTNLPNNRLWDCRKVCFFFITGGFYIPSDDLDYLSSSKRRIREGSESWKLKGCRERLGNTTAKYCESFLKDMVPDMTGGIVWIVAANLSGYQVQFQHYAWYGCYFLDYL